MGTDMFYLNQRYTKQDFYYSELLYIAVYVPLGEKGGRYLGASCPFASSIFRTSEIHYVQLELRQY